MKRLLMLFTVLSMFICTFPLPATAATQTAITRSAAEQRALAMINMTWSYSATANSTIASSYLKSITKPTQLGSVSGQKTGIPYCWGGFDGLDTSSYNQTWSGFADAVKKGAYTGNTNSISALGYIPGTAGLDCSGFVQATFQIKDYKQSTTSLLNQYFTPISLSDIKHMDILDLPGDHVVIFDSWGTLNGLSGAFTYESTASTIYGGIQGAKKYFISMNTINSGYIAARYKYIQEEVALPQPVQTGIFAKTTGNLNLRSSASSQAGILATIPSGGILYVKSYSAGWYQVSYNGQIGWVWGLYLANIPSGIYVSIKNTEMLNIRISPTVTSSIVGTLKKYQYAKVIGYSSDGKWMQIQYNNIIGWSSASYLSYIY